LQGLIEGAAVARLGEKVAVRVYTVWIGNRAVRRETREIGVFGMTNADEVMLADERALLRAGCEPSAIRPLVVGDIVRDWRITGNDPVIFPYTTEGLVDLTGMPGVSRWLWPARTTMGNRATFSKRTYFAEGRPWWEWHQVTLERLKGPTITLAFVATHNHFVLERGGKVFKQSAPVIKLPAGASEDDHFGLLGLLNSSTACFWMRQVCHSKGNGGIGGGIAAEAWEKFLEVTGTHLESFPITTETPIDLARSLDIKARGLATSLPDAICTSSVPTRENLNAAREDAGSLFGKMIGLQEELDWRCYRLYGLHETPPEHPEPPPLQLGERAFEIVMARQIAAGTLETAWFERHGSTPITELPRHWPDDYRRVVEQRIALIETDANIGMIERPEFKRRWSTDSWEEMEQAALRSWLLDRMEAPSIWSPVDAHLLSTNQVTDQLRRDTDFLSVAALYAGRPDVNLEALVAELVAKESVPFLAALRYAETGLRKRAQWEATWEKQRREDEIDAEVATRRDTFRAQAEGRAQEQWQAVNPRGLSEEPEPYAIRMQAGAANDVEQEIERLVASEEARRSWRYPRAPEIRDKGFPELGLLASSRRPRCAEGALRIVPALPARRRWQPRRYLGWSQPSQARPGDRRLLSGAQGQ
jgi:hypothetical protein